MNPLLKKFSTRLNLILALVILLPTTFLWFSKYLVFKDQFVTIFDILKIETFYVIIGTLLISILLTYLYYIKYIKKNKNLNYYNVFMLFIILVELCLSSYFLVNMVTPPLLFP